MPYMVKKNMIVNKKAYQIGKPLYSIQNINLLFNISFISV